MSFSVAYVIVWASAYSLIVMACWPAGGSSGWGGSTVSQCSRCSLSFRGPAWTFFDCRVCQMTARRFITKPSVRTWPTSMGTAALKNLKIFSPSDELVVHKLETIIDGLPAHTRWLVGDQTLFDLISKDMWRGTVQNVRRATANHPSCRRRNRRADQQSAEGASWRMEAGWVGFDEVAHQHGICRRLTALTESSHEDVLVVSLCFLFSVRRRVMYVFLFVIFRCLSYVLLLFVCSDKSCIM